MKKKGLLLIMLVMLLFLLSFSASAENITISDFRSNSTFKPVDYSTHKSISSVTLYGNADYLCMKAYKNTDDYEEFWLDIYSDSKRTKKVLEYSNTFKNGTKYEDVFFDLTELKSKTYYATSYVMKESRYGIFKQDPSTVKNFKLIVKRDGTSIEKMKTIMYGYENSPAGPVVYWYSVPGATKYYIYKKTDGEYKKFKTVKAGGGDISFFIDESLKDKNTTRIYKVRAVNGTGKTKLSENYIKANVVKTPKVKVAPYSKGGFKITWSKVASKAKYRVYMATEKSDWQLLTTTTKRSYVYDYTMNSGTVYYFTVIATTSKGTSGYELGKGMMYVENPTIKTLKEKDGNFVLTWKEVKGADSYNVYRKLKSDEDWTKLGNVKDSTFTDSSAERNLLYSYMVKSVTDGTECVYAAYQKTKGMIDVPVMNPIKVNSEGCPVISWEKISGVSYRVWRKAEGDSSWKVIGTTKETSFTDTENTVNGQKYNYTVNAYISTEHGSNNKNGASFIWYLPVKSLKPSPAAEGIGLTWENVKNVDGYNVYKKNADGEYILLGKSETNYYNDKTAEKDIRYTYKIVCISDGAEISITTTELSAMISSEYVTVSTETAKTSEPWECSVKIAEYNSEKQYVIYTKIDDTWVAAKEQRVEDGTIYFGKNDTSYVNEYALATVSDDGVVTSVYDKNIFTLNYIVPTVLSSKNDHQNYRATLSWKAVDGAEKYIVYLDGEQVTTLDSTKTSYKTSKRKHSKRYFYTVGVVKGNTEYISNETTVYIIKKPTVKVKAGADYVAVSWDSNTNVNTVYRKAEGETNWKALKKVSYRDSYYDYAVENGKTYYYTVQAEGAGRNEDGKKITFVKPTTVTGVKLGKNSIELKWKKSSVADYYIVYKYKGGSWKKVYTTKNAKTVKYKDTDVKTGKKYYYRVYVVKNGYKSKYVSKSVVFVSAPGDVAVKSVSSGAKITFDKVKGAEKYVIYRKSGNGSYKKLKTLSSSKTSYTDKSVKKGVKYTYCVKTYNGSQYSVSSSKVAFKK